MKKQDKTEDWEEAEMEGENMTNLGLDKTLREQHYLVVVGGGSKGDRIDKMGQNKSVSCEW